MKITNIWKQQDDPLTLRIEVNHRAIVYISNDKAFHLKTEKCEDLYPQCIDYVVQRIPRILRGKEGPIQPPYTATPGSGGRKLGSPNKKGKKMEAE
jgi:hypothetical protein